MKWGNQVVCIGPNQVVCIGPFQEWKVTAALGRAESSVSYRNGELVNSKFVNFPISDMYFDFRSILSIQ